MFKILIAGAVAAVIGVAGVGVAQASPDPSAACANGRLDDCYTWDQMFQFLEAADQLVLGYMYTIGVPDGALPTVLYVADGSTASSSCHDGDGNYYVTDHAYSYCASNNTIYIGQNQLWSFYTEFGAAGPVAGLAHEYGHFLQAYYGVPAPESAAESINHENQADCVAGAFISYLNDQGNIEYPGDFRNLAGFSIAIASAEGPGRDHGTVDERIGSFTLGYQGGLSVCERF